MSAGDLLPAFAFIHAKGASERVPNKNLALVGSRPLIGWAIENAFQSGCFQEIYIDSDDQRILEAGARMGATPFERPAALASNNTTGDELAFRQAELVGDEAVMAQVIPTSPFLKPETIARAVEMCRLEGGPSVFSAEEKPHFSWRSGRPEYFDSMGRLMTSQDLPRMLEETTGLYVSRTSVVREKGRRIDISNAQPIIVTPLEAIDINTPDDLVLARIVATGLEAQPIK